ncbi:hypothetical protein Q8W71_15540 [Methylobacterium sp. NEAU 140]|uniref:hypothetical protein n=1 Tax=Methylobacterium sp. NEAU 140 TaxID=3064945 RepID=UPI002732453F|nr:hypothetical protein [Methylobacterium sp. NEAU 140]MDP4024042.1 hypothetical protein [Methylobacterium sp. NEAU 140]
MKRLLKNLFALAGREDATVLEIGPGLPEAEAELAAAHERQQAAEATYKAGLLSVDEAGLLALDTARRDANVKVDRAEALVAALKERLAAAQAREAEAERVARHEAARRQADDAAAALSEMYAHLATGIVDLIEGIARAEAAVQAANADLPRGAEKIPGVERRIRSSPVFPEELLSESFEDRWVLVGQVRPGEFDQDRVVTSTRDRGLLPTPGFPNGQGRPVERRRFRVQKFLPAIGGEPANALASSVRLPGLLHGDATLFEPVERDAHGLLDPVYVLRAIEKRRRVAPRGEPTRAVNERLIPLDATPVPATPQTDHFQSFGSRFPEDRQASGRFPAGQR